MNADAKRYGSNLPPGKTCGDCQKYSGCRYVMQGRDAKQVTCIWQQNLYWPKKK